MIDGVTDPCTDLANAERLVSWYGADLRYVTSWDRWLAWDSTRWSDGSSAVHRYAMETARRMLAIAQQEYSSASEAYAAAESAETKKALARALMHMKWSTASQSANRISAMISLARHSRAVAVDHKGLDSDPWLFNCANGTLDLRAGLLLPHRRDDLITKMSPVAYDADAQAPQWEAFFARVQPDAEQRAFLYRLFGYALTGVIREHIFPVNHGRGRNGKGVTTETLLYVWGDYGQMIPTELLMSKTVDAHPAEKVTLFQTRLAAASETEKNRTLAVSLVKNLSGGDTISARRMYENPWTFAPSHKFFLSTNHRPNIPNGSTDPIWDRVILIPWAVTIPEEERDTSLNEKLRAEAAGILRLCVEGCRAWQANGLRPPAAVKGATVAYKTECEPLSEFVREVCVIDAGATTTRKMLRGAYERWAAEQGERKTMSAADFTKAVAAIAGVTAKASVKLKELPYPERGWSGIRPKTASELEQEDRPSSVSPRTHAAAC